jgi:DNA-binding MarR family transcriptional regulator
MTKGDLLIEIVNRWKAYDVERQSESIEDFSKWLSSSLEKEKAAQEPEVTNTLQKRMVFGELFGRLSNFADLWGKLAFKKLPIRNFEEYIILKTVQYNPNLPKKDLAGELVNEASTAFEIIKRHIRDGLLIDQPDEKDRRMRRVSLTSKGKELIKKADQQAAKVANIIVGDLTESEIDFMIKKLQELNHFHSELHQKGNPTNML